MTKGIDKTKKETAIPNEDRLRELKQLFPECLTEGDVDTEKLAELLNICKAGGGYLMVPIANPKGTISHGQVNPMLSASLTHLPRRR